MFAHEPRQEGVEPLPEPLLLHGSLFSQRAEWALRFGQGRRCHTPSRDRCAGTCRLLSGDDDRKYDDRKDDNQRG